MTLSIATGGIDPEAIMAEIRARVEERKESGGYRAYDLAAVRARELDNIRIDYERLSDCLPDLWRTANVDLGDFPIPAKTPGLGVPVAALKKVIWKLLKFYTFRLFSQQKEFNARAAVLLQAVILRYEGRLAELEERIGRLEKRDRRE